MLGVVVEIDGWDPVAGAPVSLFAGSHDVPAVCHLAGQGAPAWWPTLSKLPTLRYDLFDGDFSGAITAPSSTLTMRTEPWPLFGRYALADARFRLWTGNVGDAWPAWTLRFDGRITGQPKVQDGAADVSFAVDDRWLDKALLPTFAGTTGAEGEAALKGQPKPLAIGAPRYVPGVLVDSVNSVFQVSAFAIQDVEAALEKLARYGAAQGNYSGYADLIAAQLPAGSWAMARAAGLVRFGAPPTGQISFLLRGDVAGPGGWVRRPGAVIRRLAQLAGGRVDDASLAALDGARPYNVSIYLEQQTTARDLIQQLAASLNCVAGVSWTGQLFVVPIALGAPTLTLAADGSALPPVKSVQQVEIAAPWQKLAIGAERTWSVHALADIAFEAPLIDVGDYSADAVYREGNIVSLPDGSRWLYVALDPAKGMSPSDSSAAWYQLSGRIRATYDDGTPVEDLKPAQKGADVTGDNTAKDTIAVGGRKASEVLSDLDVSTAGLIAQALRQDDAQQVVEAMRFVEGQSIGTFLLEFRNAQTANNQAVNSFVQLLGAKTANGTGIILNMDTVMSAPGQTLAQKFNEVTADNGKTKASVQFLQQALVNQDGAYAKAMLRVTAGGSLAGWSATADGKVGRLSFVADEVEFVDPNGGNPIKPLFYADGRWTFGEIYATRILADTIETRHLKNSAVDTDKIALTGIRQSYGAELSANFAVPLNQGERRRVLSVAITKALDASALFISSLMRPRPARDYACQFQFGRTTNGQDSVLDTIWFWAPNATIGGVNSLRIPVPFLRTFYAIPAGQHTIWVDIIGYDGGNAQSFLEAGSNIDIEERKR